MAIKLTNLENPRTHTEYEDSYTFKIFFFEFMNFYSSLIYIAFFKGRFFDYPGDDQARRSEFFRLKNDICDPAGCLSELCIQLVRESVISFCYPSWFPYLFFQAIIMVGKQCWNNFMEYLFPKFWNWWRQRKHKQVSIKIIGLCAGISRGLACRTPRMNHICIWLGSRIIICKIQVVWHYSTSIWKWVSET